MAIADLRREYTLPGLRRADLKADPLAQFKTWFDQATGARASGRVRRFFVGLYKSLMLVAGAEPVDINAATLATADKSGCPSARTVLLKGVDARGFIFYTNYESRKGKELAENPHAALVFYWSGLERQVCVTGKATRLTYEESEAYFRSRPKGSRLAAWASRQTEPVADRATLEERYREFQARYAGGDVPMPSYWGGYVLSPVCIEFWQGRPNRLHDRFRYQKQEDGTWRIERLAP